MCHTAVSITPSRHYCKSLYEVLNFCFLLHGYDLSTVISDIGVVEAKDLLRSRTETKVLAFCKWGKAAPARRR